MFMQKNILQRRPKFTEYLKYNKIIMRFCINIFRKKQEIPQSLAFIFGTVLASIISKRHKQGADFNHC
ncbi:hypothetical protein V7127_21770 [Bacillus sp. JJ1773]